MSRIAQLFERLKGERRAALITYLTAGDPTPTHTASLVAALERGGADLIELGVPFSDPIGDGPVIQRASIRALQAGMSVKGVLEVARQIRQTSQIPLLLFSYLNPLMRYGFEALARDAAAAGIDGVLLIDLSVEEAGSMIPVLRAAGLDTVFLAAPTSTPERLQLVANYSTGFIYLVSRTGVTGEQDSLSDSIVPLTTAMRSYTHLPLAVGFGIATSEQAARVAQLADGVVVGSAVVRVVERQAATDDIESKLEALAASLAGAMNKS